ncbi:cysteine proteinase [Wolfiporia cocos MD-104 SS10]|uniref:ubiquitinyl hydrolase 1 n=1 Tax=Wolfiporia cocos (strain MD-104) TaxID=742152 RepID=A0A2H3J2E1_WOLCO|nr:cysteine proteinase [Wolfiporia cocos MD-104 SS10]
MPGVTVHPGSPASPNGGSVAEIKALAKEQAQRIRGASAISLLKSSRSQIQLAHGCESSGDLKGALSALTKAASLAQMVMDTAEFKQEMQRGKMGVLVKEFMDFQQHEGSDLAAKTQALEMRLAEAEKAEEVSASDQPVSSIAERMRALQNAGLAVSPAAPSPKRRDAARLSMPPLPSPHALVPASSFGPPSPTSSTSSSPRLSLPSAADFAQAFPSIDELEEVDGHEQELRLPSVPTAVPAQPKPFPVLPMDLGPRPSSTPIPPTIDTFASRPASPALNRSPMIPSVPRKPSALSLKSAAAASPSRSPATPPSAELDKPADLPVLTSLFPKVLYEYNCRSDIKVLLLDVRSRAEFEREHIKANAVVCIEPFVLLRNEVTAESIENALVVSPTIEQSLFSNRDKFDLVAVYDDASESFGDANTPLSVLSRAIYEVVFRKNLKRPPVLLVGGLQAWKREFGEAEVARGAGSATATASVSVNGSGEASSAAGLVNGMASLSMNGTTSSFTSQSDFNLKSPTIGHTRSPAESSTVSSSPVSTADGRYRAGTISSTELSQHKPWIPTQTNGHYSPESPPVSFRSSADLPLSPTLDASKRIPRRAPMARTASSSISYPYNHSPAPMISENTVTQHGPFPLTNGTPIQYPSVSRNISPQISGSIFSPSPALNGIVPLPPQASINPSPLARRRSDFVDQSQEALSNFAARPSIDYPDLSSQHMIRPPPVAASSSLERQDNRPRLMQNQSYALTPPKRPIIQSDYPVTYWADIQIGTAGLKNLGNTCYMNSTIQCLSATVPFARFFTDGRWKSAVNMMNPMGTKGNLAQAFAYILRDMWQGELQCLSPVTFRRSLCQYAPQFSGTEQHDSQEFLNFLLDGLHEDLNRVLDRPQVESTPEREAELERLPTQIASEQEWQIWRMRNDSLVVDLFQGQFRNRLECLTCHKTSTTYNTFMYLTLPIPSSRGLSKVSLYHCLDAFVKEEVMEKSDAWNCPYCKTLRKATKNLSLSRLPPVLMIHLKRFSSKGHFTDKIESFVDYPLKGLELTNYMPPPLPPGVSGGQQMPRDDPRAQIPPYRYDLYGVTNHFGTLSSGHYTAFIASRGGWLYCDDSRISKADPKDVVGKPAYMLFYRRAKA